ncbi:hypothetical protein [Pseudonocardia sp. T1-2H]|uniref:hypothetical protein n=1 Tax=Pseudonocardia sp. T1-2H TaxID=3128899 RepID=UPI0031013103
MIRGRNVRGIRGPGFLLAAAGLLAIPIAVSVEPTADARSHLSAPTGTHTPGAPGPGDILRLSALAPSAAPTPVAPPEPEFETGLADAAVAAAQAVVSGGTELAVAVLDRATEETALGALAAEPLYTASLSKLLVAVDLVERRRTEGLVLDPAVLDQLRRMLSASDDSAMSALWSRFDGAGAPGRVSARLGLQDTSAASDASQWGEVRVSARDYLRIYDYILGEMPAPDRTLLLDALAATTPTARDGFDQDFGLLAPAIAGRMRATAKQGWMCCFSGEYYLHSAGLLGPDERFVVALLSVQPRARGWGGARNELTSVASALAAPLG